MIGRGQGAETKRDVIVSFVTTNKASKPLRFIDNETHSRALPCTGEKHDT